MTAVVSCQSCSGRQPSIDRVQVIANALLADQTQVAACEAVCADVLRCAVLSLFLSDFAGLQQPDGSFAGDKWGEIDTRCVGGACTAHVLFGAWQLADTGMALDLLTMQTLGVVVQFIGLSRGRAWRCDRHRCNGRTAGRHAERSRGSLC